LLQNRDPHGDVEPIQNVLRIRVEIFLELANRITAIREESHLLVGLHSLGLEQIKQTALGLLVETLHQGETLT